jgi:hypothetical protein
MEILDIVGNAMEITEFTIRDVLTVELEKEAKAIEWVAAMAQKQYFSYFL